jgi:hypothetical protein
MRRALLDGTANLAHKAEHAVQSSGLAMTLLPASEGDTGTIRKTLNSPLRSSVRNPAAFIVAVAGPGRRLAPALQCAGRHFFSLLCLFASHALNMPELKTAGLGAARPKPTCQFAMPHSTGQKSRLLLAVKAAIMLSKMHTRVQAIPILTERRLTKRYPFQCRLSYLVLSKAGPQRAGSGKTLNMSSSGVLVRFDRVLPARARVKLLIQWPVALGDKALCLMIVGTVVRREGTLNAVKREKHDFFIRSSVSDICASSG